MEQLKIIRTQLEHEAALALLVELMDADPQAHSREADELEALALVIEQYEKQQFPIDLPEENS